MNIHHPVVVLPGTYHHTTIPPYQQQQQQQHDTSRVSDVNNGARCDASLTHRYRPYPSSSFLHKRTMSDDRLGVARRVCSSPYALANHAVPFNLVQLERPLLSSSSVLPTSAFLSFQIGQAIGIVFIYPPHLVFIHLDSAPATNPTTMSVYALLFSGFHISKSITSISQEHHTQHQLESEEYQISN